MEGSISHSNRHHMSYSAHVSVVDVYATTQDTREIAIWHCTVIAVRQFIHGRLHITHSLPANEPPKGEGVCRGTGYTAHEMCTMWLSSAVGSQSQAPLSLLCLDTDSE